jgi:hypothetical protein
VESLRNRGSGISQNSPRGLNCEIWPCGFTKYENGSGSATDPDPFSFGGGVAALLGGSASAGVQQSSFYRMITRLDQDAIHAFCPIIPLFVL